jgi:hypothetical protein
VFFHHPRYRSLSSALPHAMQIPLLHLFPRIEQSCTIRIPQSGWLDEEDPARRDTRVTRTHRWERVTRDGRSERPRPDGKYSDKVTVALFSTDPDILELYGKPMARNAQIWTPDAKLLLDGPRADHDAIAEAARATSAGGRFGYRFLFPAMRAGARELYWHRPVVARRAGTGAQVLVDGPIGYVSAEHASEPPLMLAPRVMDRPAYRQAARLFEREPGLARFTTSHNARKLLEMSELLDHDLAPSFARALLRIGRNQTLDEWIAHLPEAASDRLEGARLAVTLRALLAERDAPGDTITIDAHGTRAFEESIWRSISDLSEGEYRQKENADAISVNRGRHGGPAAKAAGIHVSQRRDLEALGDHLHERHRALIAAAIRCSAGRRTSTIPGWRAGRRTSTRPPSET